MNNKETPTELLRVNDELLTQLRNSTWIVHYRGRHKVEVINFIASSKDEAIQLSQQYCTERKLRWMCISPVFVDLNEKMRELPTE